MRRSDLVHKGRGVLDVEHEREVDARHDVVAGGAVAHRVLVRARLRRDHKRDAVPPVCVVAARRPLAEVHAVALDNARAAGWDRQKHLDARALFRNCRFALRDAFVAGC